MVPGTMWQCEGSELPLAGHLLDQLDRPARRASIVVEKNYKSGIQSQCSNTPVVTSDWFA